MDWIHGAAYYPELWDKKVWENDVLHMKKLGINTVRIGEFAWAVMEPDENEFHFEKFDEILSFLYENGISVVLCTPTPTPPIWISYGHPERLYSDGGVPFSHGGRQHVCTNNPYFRERVKIIVTEMAKRFGNHPAVIAWQIDNELKCDAGECYCEECGRQWHEWLADKYGTIKELNKAWGNGVWSQAYQSFEQIPRPIRVPKLPNPSLTTNYTHFSHEKVAEFFKLQTDIIRKYSDKEITHNGSSWFGVDNTELSKLQDFVSFDAYPTSDNYYGYLFECRHFRGLKPDGRFMCLETSPGFNGCTKSYDAIHPADFLSAEATATFAFGGVGFSYWHFHQHRAGCEMIHGSMLTADGTPTICYPEVQKVNERLKEVKSALSGFKRVKPKIAIQFSDRARAMMITENYHGMNYISLLQEFHNVLTKAQYDFDIIPNDADVEDYDLIFTPFQYALDGETVGKMNRFCENGGVWVVGPMTGIRTSEHTLYTECAVLPQLSRILGLKEAFLYPTLGSNCKLKCDGEGDKMRYFTLSGKADDAKVLATVDELGERSATFTVHKVGNGMAISFGAMPESEQFLIRMINNCIAETTVQPVSTATDGIITVAYENENAKMVFGFDFGGKGGKFSFNDETVSVLPYGFNTIIKNKF